MPRKWSPPPRGKDGSVRFDLWFSPSAVGCTHNPKLYTGADHTPPVAREAVLQRALDDLRQEVAEARKATTTGLPATHADMRREAVTTCKEARDWGDDSSPLSEALRRMPKTTASDLGSFAEFENGARNLGMARLPRTNELVHKITNRTLGKIGKYDHLTSSELERMALAQAAEERAVERGRGRRHVEPVQRRLKQLGTGQVERNSELHIALLSLRQRVHAVQQRRALDVALKAVPRTTSQEVGSWTKE